MRGVDHHDASGAILTAFNEVHKSVPYILDKIIVLFYKRLYDILCLMLTF